MRLIAITDPGEAAPLNPAPSSWKVVVPATPPAMTAKNMSGRMRTYGK